MAWRLWLGLGCLAAAIVCAAVASATGDPWFLIAGALGVLGLSVLASRARFWRRLAPRLPPMPNLMMRPRPGQRWCARCGRPAPRRGPCPACGVAAARERRKLRRLQRKQRAASQEKKT